MTGVAPTVRADLLEAGEKSFDRLKNINLKVQYFLSQLDALRMVDEVHSENRESEFDGITENRQYLIGIWIPPSINRGDYCISKAGITMMTAAYAARLAEFGINV